MIKVSSVDLQRNLSQYRELAVREPVIVTSYNKPQIVMLSAELFDKMQSGMMQGGSEPYSCDRYARAIAAHTALHVKHQSYQRLYRESADFLEAMFTLNTLNEGPGQTLLEIAGYVLRMSDGHLGVKGLSPFIETFSEGCMHLFKSRIRQPFGTKNEVSAYPDRPELVNVRSPGLAASLLGMSGDPDVMANWMTSQVIMCGYDEEDPDALREKLIDASRIILLENKAKLESALSARDLKSMHDELAW